MSEVKRMRVRAIIIKDEELLSMYREKEGRIFYTFPGGGAEENETEEQCVIREVEEEFGIVVKPVKKLYTYENNISIEHFYLCEWVKGDFGSGAGEEFSEGNTNGLYRPVKVAIKNIPNIPLMPPEVAYEFYNDFVKNGINIRNDIKKLYQQN